MRKEVNPMKNKVNIIFNNPDEEVKFKDAESYQELSETLWDSLEEGSAKLVDENEREYEPHGLLEDFFPEELLLWIYQMNNHYTDEDMCKDSTCAAFVESFDVECDFYFYNLYQMFFKQGATDTLLYTCAKQCVRAALIHHAHDIVWNDDDVLDDLESDFTVNGSYRIVLVNGNTFEKEWRNSITEKVPLHWRRIINEQNGYRTIELPYDNICSFLRVDFENMEDLSDLAKEYWVSYCD